MKTTGRQPQLNNLSIAMCPRYVSCAPDTYFDSRYIQKLTKKKDSYFCVDVFHVCRSFSLKVRPAATEGTKFCRCMVIHVPIL